MRAIKMLFLTASILGLIPRAAAFAAPADVHHFAFRGSVAEGAWLSRTDTSFTFTYVNAMKTRTDQELFVDQDTTECVASVRGERRAGSVRVSYSLSKGLVGSMTWTLMGSVSLANRSASAGLPTAYP